MSNNEFTPHFELKDEKAGSYKDSAFNPINDLLWMMHKNNLLNWDDVQSIEKVLMNRIAYHLQYVIRKLPYNADIYIHSKSIEHNGITVTYSDDHLKLRLRVIKDDAGEFHVDCSNIITVDCDKDHTITVTDIQRTQQQIKEQCEKVFAALK